MSIIKIHLYRHNSTKQQKYLLTYIPEIHSTIASFIHFAINALNIQTQSKDNVVIQNDGYTIPQCLDGKILEKVTQLTIKVNIHVNQTKKISTNVITSMAAHKIDLKPIQIRLQQQSPQIIRSRMEEENLSDSSTPKFSEDGLAAKKKKSLITQKIIKKKQTNKIAPQINKKSLTKKTQKVQIKKPQISSSSSDSSLQEIEEIKQIPKKSKLQQPKKDNKKKQQFKKQSSDSSESQSSISQQQQQSVEKQQPGDQSSSQSSQSSEEQLPRVIRTKKAQMQEKIQKKQTEKVTQLKVPQKKAQILNKNEKKPLLQKFTKAEKPLFERQQVQTLKVQKIGQKGQPQLPKVTQVKPKTLPVTYANRKKLIDSDIESSDSQSSLEELRSKVKKINGQQQIKSIVAQNGSNYESKYLQEKQSVNVFVQNHKAKMVPPSLRNKSPLSQQQPKPTVSPFKQHQLQQWIPVTKELISTYKLTLTEDQKQTPFLKPNNLVRFKQIQLDEERFVPKESQWIEGTVNRVQKDGKLILSKVTELGKQYRQKYDTYEHNMVVLEVNRNYLIQQQKDIALPQQKDNNAEVQNTQQKQQQNIQQQELKSINQKQQNQQNLISDVSKQQQAKQDKTSVQKFICGQVNFYFSQKNYPFDLFMQMHANKNPQKYIPIRFLLNFPKIKKILKDEHKLLQYLIGDQKKADRNFQLDEQRRLVRRKIVSNNNKIMQSQKPNQDSQQGTTIQPQ